MTSPNYVQRLRYPERAESLSPQRFLNYNIDLKHWEKLSTVFRDAYQTVHARGMSRVLLVHGPQGSGKSLFCKRLEEGYGETLAMLRSGRPVPTDREKNLWHLLVQDPGDRDETQHRTTLERMTRSTRIRRVPEKSGWLQSLIDDRSADDGADVHVLIIDNFQNARFLSEIAELTLDYCIEKQKAGQEDVLYSRVGERLVSLARNDLHGSIFVCLSNDRGTMEGLKEAIERVHIELPLHLEVPQPPAPAKERIVRTNLNRFNPVSYWHCLDQAPPDERKKVWSSLVGEEGVGRVYQQVERGYGAGRSGAPAHRNLMTLVTIGTPPAEVRAHLSSVWEDSSSEVHYGTHLGVWTFDEGFATRLADEDERPCKLFDSEFRVRWVALGPSAAEIIAKDGASADADQLLALIDAATDTASDWEAVEAQLALFTSSSEWFNAFRDRGAGRSLLYEPALARRYRARGLDYSTALPGTSGTGVTVKPDVTLTPYSACALSGASDPGGIPGAMRRQCKVIEYTAHLSPELEGIDDYLLKKIKGYASLLEAL